MTPRFLQTVVQSVIDILQEGVASCARGLVERSPLEVRDVGWHHRELWWVWHVRRRQDKVDMTLINPNKFKHILRHCICRRAPLALEDRGQRQF